MPGREIPIYRPCGDPELTPKESGDDGFTPAPAVPVPPPIFRPDEIRLEPIVLLEPDQIPVYPLPNPPTGLVATAISAFVILLTWNNPTEGGADSFRIEEFVDGSWATLVTVSGSTFVYAQFGLIPETTHTYRVFSVRRVGESEEPSNSASATLPSIAASGFKGISISDTEIDLSWTIESVYPEGYRVERLDEGVWTEIASVSNVTNSYPDSGLVADTSYEYRLVTVGPTADFTSSPAVASTKPGVLNPSFLDFTWSLYRGACGPESQISDWGGSGPSAYFNNPLSMKWFCGGVKSNSIFIPGTVAGYVKIVYATTESVGGTAALYVNGINVRSFSGGAGTTNELVYVSGTNANWQFELRIGANGYAVLSGSSMQIYLGDA